MKRDKRLNNTHWLSHKNLKFRIKELDRDHSILWASIDGVDLCFTLILYDFLERFQEKHNIPLEINSAWNNRRGLQIKASEADFLMHEIANFVVEWDIAANESGDQLSDDLWYSA